MSRYCDTSAIDALLKLAGTAPGDRAQTGAGTVLQVVQESRAAAGDASARAWASVSPRDSGPFIEGLRNRLALKYLGVDYEYYNNDSMRYRSALP